MSYNSIMNTFRDAEKLGNNEVVVYSNMFGEPVRHNLDVGDKAFAREKKELEKVSLTNKKVVVENTAPVSELAKNAEIRQKMYEQFGGVPGKFIRDHVVDLLKKTTEGGLLRAFMLPSKIQQTGANVLVQGYLHPVLQELVKRTLAANSVRYNETDDTTLFLGTLVPFEENGTINLLSTVRSGTKGNYCDVSGVCVNNDDYVQYKGRDLVVPIVCAAPSAEENDDNKISVKNRSFEDILSVVRTSNASANGSIIASNSNDGCVFRMVNVTDDEAAILNITGSVKIYTIESKDLLDHYVLWKTNNNGIETIVKSSPSFEVVLYKVQWHRNRAKIIVASVVLLILAIVVIVLAFCFSRNTSSVEVVTVPAAAPTTAPVPAASPADKLTGGAAPHVPLSVPSVRQPTDTLSVMIEGLKKRVLDL